jgi:hypothetical protein
MCAKRNEPSDGASRVVLLAWCLLPKAGEAKFRGEVHDCRMRARAIRSGGIQPYRRSRR